ncbi:MAG: DinB family protein [Leptolyngbyaceae cyanobacterium bins.302]|nr:DinB family protein [Leptolyngbyaceae cyanobacterium bins.302]
MSDRKHYELMAEYSQWMNQKLYALCVEIPDETRKQDLGAFFKSIHGTLNHILFGDRAWMGRFINQPFAAKIGEELYSDFEELHQERIKTDLHILKWSKTLTNEWLNQPFTYMSGIDQKTRTLPTWILVTHMFNHQTHHRGQLTTLLNQLGYDPGVTDIPWMLSLNTKL